MPATVAGQDPGPGAGITSRFNFGYAISSITVGRHLAGSLPHDRGRRGWSGWTFVSCAGQAPNFATSRRTGEASTAGAGVAAAQRGKLQHQRSDLCGSRLGAWCTRDWRIPLTWPRPTPAPGPLTSSLSAPAIIEDQLLHQGPHRAVTAAGGRVPGCTPQTWTGSSTLPEPRGTTSPTWPSRTCHAYSVPASELPGLTACPPRPVISGRSAVRRPEPPNTRREPTHPAPHHLTPTHTSWARRPFLGFDGTTLAMACKKLYDWPPPWPRGKTPAAQGKIKSKRRSKNDHTRKPFVAASYLAARGDQPKELAPAWSRRPGPRTAWNINPSSTLRSPITELARARVIAGYRFRIRTEFSFRQMKDPHVGPSLSPMPTTDRHETLDVHVFPPASWALQIPTSCAAPTARPYCNYPSASASPRSGWNAARTIRCYRATRRRPKPAADHRAHRDHTAPTNSRPARCNRRSWSYA